MNDRQLRAARAILNWTRQDLAEASGASISSIQQAELGNTTPHPSTAQKLKQTLEEKGIEFVEGGARLQDRTLVRRLEGPTADIEMLQDVFNTLQGHGELLFMFTRNDLSTPDIVEEQKRIRTSGVRFRGLIREDDAAIRYPIQEYRQVEHDRFVENPCFIYGRKIAFSTAKTGDLVVIDDEDLARVMTQSFNVFWDQGSMPTHTTLEDVHV